MITFSLHHSGGTKADFSSSGNEGDTDLIAIAAVPELAVGNVITFSKSGESGRGVLADFAPTRLLDNTYGVINGVAEYTILGIEGLNYRVVRGAT